MLPSFLEYLEEGKYKKLLKQMEKERKKIFKHPKKTESKMWRKEHEEA